MITLPKIIQKDLYGERDLVKIAIDRLQMYEPKEGYWVGNSGGKDSCTIIALLELSGVKYKAYYNHTTADPPELIYFLKGVFPNTIINYPSISMWELIIKKRMPPTRKVPYCCDILKEGGGDGETVVLGVRWAESPKRKSRGLVEESTNNKRKRIIHFNDNDDTRRSLEICPTKGKHILNIIIEWEDHQVWEFLKKTNTPYCCLYDQGFDRLGCVGCPKAGGPQQIIEFLRWPKYKNMYILAFQKMIEKRKKDGLSCQWLTGEEVFLWWISKGICCNNKHNNLGIF